MTVSAAAAPGSGTRTRMVSTTTAADALRHCQKPTNASNGNATTMMYGHADRSSRRARSALSMRSFCSSFSTCRQLQVAHGGDEAFLRRRPRRQKPAHRADDRREDQTPHHRVGRDAEFKCGFAEGDEASDAGRHAV